MFTLFVLTKIYVFGCYIFALTIAGIQEKWLFDVALISFDTFEDLFKFRLLTVTFYANAVVNMQKDTFAVLMTIKCLKSIVYVSFHIDIGSVTIFFSFLTWN